MEKRHYNDFYLEVENFEPQILELIHCTKEEHIYTVNQHMLIFGAKKSGAVWVGGWAGGWVDGWVIKPV